MEFTTTYIASWWLSTEVGEIFVGLIQDSMLLFNAHLDRILMRIAMEASMDVFFQHDDHPPSGVTPIHFMSCISYHSTFFGESVQGVSRNEPGGLDVVLCEQLQETANANRTSEETLDHSAQNSRKYIGIGIPLEISLVESSPPYDPSQPATASMSTDMQQSASAIVSGQNSH